MAGEKDWVWDFPERNLCVRAFTHDIDDSRLSGMLNDLYLVGDT